MRYYFKCIKLFVGYKRTDSVTNMLFALNLPSFNTILHNHGEIVVLLEWRGDDLGNLTTMQAIHALGL